jgi:hypothetical protein
LSTDPGDKETKKARCNPADANFNNGSWKSQTECCKANGGCGYSGGPSGRECWAPDFAAKKCVKWRLDDPKANCNTGLEGGFQYEGICISESFPGGAAISNRMAPVQQPAPQDKMAPKPTTGAPQDKMAPTTQPAPQDKMAPKPMQDKMAPTTMAPTTKGPATVTIKYNGRGSSDFGGDVDIPSAGQAFTKICGGVTKVIAACNATKGCVAFTVESKDVSNPAACGYLKKAGGSIRSRQGWTAFVRE